jgi:hypothetical protein
MRTSLRTTRIARTGAGLLLTGFAFHAAAGPVPGAAPPVPGQDARLVTLSAAYAPDREALWMLDRGTRRLAVYRVGPDGLTVVAVREITYDFKLVEYPPRRQNPSVLEMVKASRPQPPPGKPPRAAPVRLPMPMPVGSLLMTKGSIEMGRDAVYVTDSTNRKLAVYTTDGRALKLEFVRDLQADLKAVDFSSGSHQGPTVQDVYEATKPREGPGKDPKAAMRRKDG